MHEAARHSIRIRTLLLLLVILLGIALAPLKKDVARSGVGTTLAGYIWSDNVGWISLSGSNYGISIDGSGNLSGYAWSDSIGWISANSADLAGCPSAPCAASDVNGVFSGWLKALATGGGWDGFISLAGSGYGVTERADGSLTGYGWGSDVVGWIDFSYATPLAPSCTLAANPTSIVRGNNVTLSWTSTRSSSGSIAPGAINASPVSSGSTGVQPQTTTTYTATFTGSGGSSQCSAQVTVSCASTYGCNGSTITYTDATCNATNVTTCTSPSYCSAGQSTCAWPPPVFNPSGTLSGHLQARPAIVRNGLPTHLYWNVSNAVSCTVTGGGQSWSGLSSGVSGVSTNPITQTTTYSLACTAYSGQSNINESVDVLVQPNFREQ